MRDVGGGGWGVGGTDDTIKGEEKLNEFALKWHWLLTTMNLIIFMALPLLQIWLNPF